MTLRRPLTLVDKNNFREMTNLGGSGADMYKIHQQIAYLYSQNLVQTLSYVSSGGDFSPTMTDTRYRSGTARKNTSSPWPAATSVPSLGQTGAIEQITTVYDRVNSTIVSGPVNKPTYSLKPVRVDGTSSVIEMSETDVIDTFIDPVIDLMETETTDPRAGGSYFISTSTSLSNSANLGTIFSDTRANQGAYTGAGIGNTGSYQDHHTTTNYQLFKNNGVDAAYPKPLIVDGTSGLREMTTSEFSTYFTALIRACIFGETGHTLRYNFNGSGSTKGTAITNTGQTSADDYFFKQETSAFGGDDYRAQRFPNGSQVTIETYTLKLERT